MVCESNLRHPLSGKTQNHFLSDNAIPEMRQSDNGVFMLRQAVGIAGWSSCCVFRVIAPSASDCSMDAKPGRSFRRAGTYHQMSREDVVRAGIGCIESHCAASVSAHAACACGHQCPLRGACRRRAGSGRRRSLVPDSCQGRQGKALANRRRCSTTLPRFGKLG